MKINKQPPTTITPQQTSQTSSTPNPSNLSDTGKLPIQQGSQNQFEKGTQGTPTTLAPNADATVLSRDPQQTETLQSEVRKRSLDASMRPPSPASSASVATLLNQLKEMPNMTATEQRRVQQQMAQQAIASPSLVDQILAQAPAESKKAFGEAVLGSFAEHGRKTEAFRTHENHGRMLQMMEAIDPNATPKDLSRALRREFYSDDQLQFVGATMGSGEPKLNDSLKRIFEDRQLGWQEITGPDGKKLDIAHSMVALDAALNNEGTSGRLKAWLFTDFGDFASGLLSKIGVTGAGNNNEIDQRGNAFGEQLFETQRDKQFDKLTDLLQHSFASERYLK